MVEATKLPLSRSSRGRSRCRGRRRWGEGGGEGCGGREGAEGGNDLPGKTFYPVTRLDKFANFSGKAKPPGYPVTIPR